MRELLHLLLGKGMNELMDGMLRMKMTNDDTGLIEEIKGRDFYTDDHS